MTQSFSFLSQLKTKGFMPIFLGIFLSFFAKGHAVLSLSVLLLVLFSFLFISKNKEIAKRDFIYLGLMFFYLWIVFSGFWSQDTFYFFQKMNLKSALIAVAFSFFWIPNISIKHLEKIAQFILCIFIVSTFFVGYMYLQNHIIFSQNIMKGQALWVPIRSHIRYGLLLNFCFLLSLFFSYYYHTSKLLKSKIYAALAIYFLLFIHFLSVRSAILSLYVSLLCFGVFWILKTRKYIQGAFVALGLVLIFYSMVLTIPTLSKKVGYMRWDIQEFLANPAHQYSDGSRWHSIQVGLEIFKKQTLLGVGEGDMKQAISSYTGLEKGEETMLPHNEFVYIMAANGIVGLCIFFTVLCYSIWYAWSNKLWLPFAYTASMIAAFMVEPMLETQLGVLVFVLPFCLFYKIDYHS